MKRAFFLLAVLFAVIASSMAQFTITGPTTVYEDDISVWYPANLPSGTTYVRMHAGNFTGNISFPEDEYQFDLYRMTPSGTGSFILSAQAEPGDETVYSGRIYVVENPNPPVPPTPTITGDGTVSVYDVEAYSQPSGKQDYEWIMPFSGCYHVQEYNNIKVIGFTAAGNRTLRGRYKENGVWSEYGNKSIVVSQ